MLDKKKEWANSVYEKTMKKLLLEEFPVELTAKTFNMHKSNDKMFNLLERVEHIVYWCIEANRKNVSAAIHKI